MLYSTFEWKSYVGSIFCLKNNLYTDGILLRITKLLHKFSCSNFRRNHIASTLVNFMLIMIGNTTDGRNQACQKIARLDTEMSKSWATRGIGQDGKNKQTHPGRSFLYGDLANPHRKEGCKGRGGSQVPIKISSACWIYNPGPPLQRQRQAG